MDQNRKIYDEYNLAKAFHIIEDGIIEQISKNLNQGIDADDFQLWKAEQMAILSADDASFIRNPDIVNQFRELNANIESLLQATTEEAKEKEEKKILDKVKTAKVTTRTATTELIGILNRNKMNALIMATLLDMEKAETATLRRADDIYRRIVFDAETYLATFGDLKKSVDMAAHEFIANGIRSIEYKNGARVNIGSYAEMALRTANKRAYLQGEAWKREEYGLNLVIVNSRSQACPHCLPFLGKVFVDDVYGSAAQAGPIQSKYPRLSEAINQGLYHPNCKDSHSTFYEGITELPKQLTSEEKEEARRVYQLEQKQRYNERHIRKYKRLEKYSIDPEQREKYKGYREKWQLEQRKLIANNPEELRRDYNREKIYK